MSTQTYDPLAELASVRARMAEAMKASGRQEAPTLILVTKTVEAARIAPVIAAGERDFGENRVQEAKAKWPDLKAGAPDLRLHLVGPLQTNKAKDALALFDAIHSLDRIRLAEALRKEIDRAGRAPALFVQVNTGLEPQKAGVAPDATDAFLEEVRGLGLAIEGLMCVPPVDEAPALHFALLRKIAERNGLRALSMGMSGDFETAIRFGATHLRIGSAVFGARPPPPAPSSED